MTFRPQSTRTLHPAYHILHYTFDLRVFSLLLQRRSMNTNRVERSFGKPSRWTMLVRMRFQSFQIDAFTDALFSGNPAVVVVIGGDASRDQNADIDWPEDEWLQSVAIENNVSETAYIRRARAEAEHDYDLRWFMPATEVNLCGHATLSAAHVLFSHLDHKGARVTFQTRSGELTVTRRDNGYEMDFPAKKPERVEISQDMRDAIGLPILDGCRSTRDLLLVVDSEASVRQLEPDIHAIAALDVEAVIVTSLADAPGVDFVSRFFAPRMGVPEDPVTGSAHCLLGPYWHSKMSKTRLSARQVGARGGAVGVTIEPDRGRVLLFGEAVTYLVGEIFSPCQRK